MLHLDMFNTSYSDNIRLSYNSEINYFKNWTQPWYRMSTGRKKIAKWNKQWEKEFEISYDWLVAACEVRFVGTSKNTFDQQHLLGFHGHGHILSI